MSTFFSSKKLKGILLPIFVAAIGFSASSHDSFAQSNEAIPVLVMAEDEDRLSVKRSSDIFKRVTAALQESMRRYDFTIRNENSVAAELGWKIADRRPAIELISQAKSMNRSDLASTRVRALVLLRVHAAAREPYEGRTEVVTRISGEIYDAVSNEFIGTYELPKSVYPAPADCMRNKACITEVVGTKAREISASLGTVLAKKLDYLHEKTRDNDGDLVDRDSKDYGLVTPYTFVFNYFDTKETSTMVNTIKDEFPGTRGVDLMNKAPSTTRYEVRTTAKAHKIEEWMTILLDHMDYDTDRDIEILINGTTVTVDKINTDRKRERSDDERSLYN